jgi:hypothetical protein
VRSGQGSFLSLRLYGGGPSLGLGGDDVTPLSSGVWPVFTAVLLLYGTDDLSLEGSLASSNHTRRSPLRGRLSAATYTPYSASGMDLGHEVTWYVYIFANTSLLRGRYWRHPGGLARVIHQVLAPSGLGLAPTANSPGSGSQTSLFLLLLCQRG